MGNKASSPGPPAKPSESMEKCCGVSKAASVEVDPGGAAEEEDVCELPPPMEIQDHLFKPQQTTPDFTIDPADHEEKTVPEEANPLTKEKQIPLQDDDSETTTSQEDPQESSLETVSDGNEREKSLQKRSFVLKELVDTEQQYVTDLGYVVEGYITVMRSGEVTMPDDLKNGKDKIIFGNIEAIYEWHRDLFMAELEKCLEEPERLGLLFRRYERRLNMYVVYCQNKPKSEYIVSEYIDTYFEEIRQKLGHKLQLPDLLIKPVQRIMKYQLLLKDILKYTERAQLHKEAEDLRKAVHIMHVVPKAANDMMNVGRLQGFDGKITAQGKLLLQGLLLVSDPSSGNKFRERQVFLFEQIIILSEAVGAKTPFSNQAYIYKNHLQVNKMSLNEHTEDCDPLKFALCSKDPHQEGLTFVIQTPSMESRNEWVSNIRAILETQLDFLRAIQSPIAYQKELTKDISAPELGSLWNPSLRKTLSHPAAAHKSVRSSVMSDSVPTLTSKSMRHPGRDKKLLRPSTTGGSGVMAEAEDVQRKHSFPVAQQQSPGKGKRNFFEGFRNTLRPKAAKASEPPLCFGHSLDSATRAATLDPGDGRRWSETARPATPTGRAFGSENHTISEECFQALQGEHNCSKGPVDIERSVSWTSDFPCTPSNEDTEPRRAWSFKFKKPSFRLEKKKKRQEERSVELSGNEQGSDVFLEPVSCVTTQVGTCAVLGCCVSPTAVSVSWLLPSGACVKADSEKKKVLFKMGASDCDCFSEARERTLLERVVALLHADRTCTLEVIDSRVGDSGLYTCLINTQDGCVISSAAELIVVGKPSQPGKPQVVTIQNTMVQLQWEPVKDTGNCHMIGYRVEKRATDLNMWVAAGPPTTRCTQTIYCDPGSYAFRVLSSSEFGTSDPGEESDPVTLTPRAGDECCSPSPVAWKEGFQLNYVEIAVCGRGRFSEVKKCVEVSSGKRVASKVFAKELESLSAAEEEFLIAQRFQHEALIEYLEAYQTPESYILILSFIDGLRLFDHVCNMGSWYSEHVACHYIIQLLQALDYLHLCGIAHLDVKPENIMVEECTSQLKLLDFGSARKVLSTPQKVAVIGDAEFAAPEIIRGDPVTCKSDIWSLGVLLYVFLTGRSPFLDNSKEGMYSNITDAYYAFPDNRKVSDEARELVREILVTETEKRPGVNIILSHRWVKDPPNTDVLDSSLLLQFTERRDKLVCVMNLIFSGGWFACMIHTSYDCTAQASVG